jgi:hypothetical protein
MQRLQSDADTRHHLGPTRIVMTALAAYDATGRAGGNEIAAYWTPTRGVICLSFRVGRSASPGPRKDRFWREADKSLRVQR